MTFILTSIITVFLTGSPANHYLPHYLTEKGTLRILVEDRLIVTTYIWSRAISFMALICGSKMYFSYTMWKFLLSHNFLQWPLNPVPIHKRLTKLSLLEAGMQGKCIHLHVFYFRGWKTGVNYVRLKCNFLCKTAESTFSIRILVDFYFEDLKILIDACFTVQAESPFASTEYQYHSKSCHI